MSCAPALFPYGFRLCLASEEDVEDLQMPFGGCGRLIKRAKKLASGLMPRMADFKRAVLSEVIPSVAHICRSASLGPSQTDGCRQDASLQKSFRRYHSLGGQSVCIPGMPAGVVVGHCANLSFLPGIDDLFVLHHSQS